MDDRSQYQQNYEELELLGKNIEDSSKLFLVRDKHSISQIQYRMAKKIHIYDSSQTSQQKLLNQVRLLKDLNNPHILKYFDVCLQNDELILILEFCQGKPSRILEGDLLHYIEKRKQRKQLLSEKLILSWLLQILMGLQYIHSRNIIHRLVSMNNIFMNHQGDLKIGSFGAAKVLQNTLEKAHTIIGSPCNMSPQIVEGKPYDSKADIWALGCLVYELCTFESPFKFSNLPQLYNSIVKNPPPQLPLKYSKHVSPIFKKMMKKSPSVRSSASQLLQQQIFIQLMKEYTKKKKIDALDLRQIVPKQLASHKKKPSNNKKSTLPPLSNSREKTTNVRKQKANLKVQQKSDSSFRSKSNNKKLQPLNAFPKPFSKNNKDKEIYKAEQIDKNRINNINSTPIKSIKLDGLDKCKEDIKQRLQKSKQNSDIQSSEDQQRLTRPNLEQAQYISLLCQVHLEYLTKKYEPKMEQIFQRTIQFDDL